MAGLFSKMKIQVEIDINCPREKVLEYYTNTANLKYWVAGFDSFEWLTDAKCTVGSSYLVKFHVGNMNIQVRETITRNDLPEEIWYQEESEGISNIAKNFFVEIDERSTKWVIISNYESEYMKHIGLSAFEKKTYKFMESFKEFVENN